MRFKAASFVLSCVLLFSCLSSVAVEATSSSDIETQKQETQDAIDDATEKKKQAEEQASSLQQEADAIESNYNILYSQLSAINDKIASANASIANTQSEISELEAELEEAQQQEKIQYEAMKVRMAYIYENSRDLDIFTALITSGSFSEFLNRANMISEILNYDRKLLASYQELQEVIASKSDQLAAKAEELKGYEESLSASQDEMDALVSGVAGDLTAKNDELSDAEGDVAAYEAEIATLQEKMKSLEAQAAQAQAEAAKAIAEQLQEEQDTGTVEDTSGSVSASDSDLIMLAATIQAESDNQSYEGKLAVGSVIMNRVKSSKFPNTISGVITQNKQFASYSSGMVTAIMTRGPNDTCLSVAREVIAGKRNGNWLFFMTKAYADKFGITGYTQIGDHVFFLIWGANESDAGGETDTTGETDTSGTTDASEDTDTSGTTDASGGTDAGGATDDSGGTDADGATDDSSGTDTSGGTDSAG